MADGKWTPLLWAWQEKLHGAIIMDEVGVRAKDGDHQGGRHHGTRARRRVLLVFVFKEYGAFYSAAAAAAALRTYLTMGLPLGPTTMAV